MEAIWNLDTVTRPGKHNEFNIAVISIRHTKNKLADGGKSFDDPIKDVNDKVPIEKDGQAQRRKGHFTTIINRITSGGFCSTLIETIRKPETRRFKYERFLLILSVRIPGYTMVPIIYGS